MRVTGRRKIVWVWLVITLLVSMATVNIPVSVGAPATVLSAPTIIDVTLTPTSTFYINITVADVTNMGGYKFYLYYNTTVLTATSYSSYAPFTWKWPSKINDTAGYVAMAYTIVMGAEGLSTVAPVPIARIDFTVDAEGWSLLDIISGTGTVEDSEIGDVGAGKIAHEVVDGYFSNVTEFPHDIAVTAVEVSPTRDITPGESVSINVTVANQAPFSETFTVTAYANTTEVDSEGVTLAELRSTVIQLEWDTTGFAFGPYNISANASVVAEETETDDNTLSFDDMAVVGTHDVAVTAVTATPTRVVFGESVYIDVTVANEGNFTETFNITTTYSYLSIPTPPPGAPSETDIKKETNIPLGAGNSVTLNSTLDTSNVIFDDKKVVGLQIKANASAVPYETNTSNNIEDFKPVYIWIEYATLEAPVVVDPSLEPGQTFSMNITIANVEKMLAYGFFLDYNATVLWATNLTSYSPFTKQVQYTINNTGGWIYMNYTTVNATTRLTTVDPKPIARIDFNVDSNGTSLLDIRDPKIKTAEVGDVPLITVDGNFANILYPHDISVSLEKPPRLYLGDSSLLNATVYNYGFYNETNVELQLLINGSVVYSNTTDLLSLQSKTWSYNWTPPVEGIYNITAFAPPVTGEQTRTKNNNATSMVTVQLVKPKASFTILALFPYEGETWTFDAKDSSSVDSTIISYKWNFDDGNITEVTDPKIKHIYTTKGTYEVRLTVTDGRGQSSNTTKTLTVYRRDVAVLSVTPSVTKVTVGKSLNITAVVANLGDYQAETFNVTVYYDDTLIQTKTVTTLAISANKTVEFSWSTSGVSLGTYTIKANATTVYKETNTTNNVLISDVSVTVVTHNVAVTGVEVSMTEVTVGDTVTISVTVVNKGNFTETFNATTYYDGNLIETQTDVSLEAGATQTLTFTWDTTGIDPGTYAISANATVVSGEIDTADNTHVGDTVTVKEAPAGTDLMLYAVGGIVIAIAAATIVVYVLRSRKPKAS